MVVTHELQKIGLEVLRVNLSEASIKEERLSAEGLQELRNVLNKPKDHDGEHAALLEAALRRQRLVVYGRYEWVQKSVEELNLDEAYYGHDALFPVNAFTLGAGYYLLHATSVRISLGAQLSVFHADSRLDALYGNNPVSGEVYLRFYPTLMKMKHGM